MNPQMNLEMTNSKRSGFREQAQTARSARKPKEGSSSNAKTALVREARTSRRRRLGAALGRLLGGRADIAPDRPLVYGNGGR